MARPQSMMFTLLGDYIMDRGGEIWVGSLIEIAAQFGLSQQAVRSALSRMSQHEWLTVSRVGNRSYYGATERTTKLLEEGQRRIFVRRSGPWNGDWHILVYSIPERKREVRTELRKQLSWLGYGPLSSGSWICPHDVEADVVSAAQRLGVAENVETFTAQHLGFATDRDLAGRCWDLAGINIRYEAFLARYGPLCEQLQTRSSVADNECFVQRFTLIHEFRKFFFIDPELPSELVPAEWHGVEARDLFHSFHNLLAEPANRYFDSVFEAPAPRRKKITPKRSAVQNEVARLRLA